MLARRAKKVINNPADVVSELIDGLVVSSRDRLRMLDGRNVVVRADLAPGKVAVLIGGGSGHEPLFPGFVGENLADGAVCGNIFAAPTPDLILEATRAVDRGRGVLYLYGNYAGDNLNFDIAAELAEAEGHRTRTVRVWDDVASAPPERMCDRRGIAGDLFVIKIAGAAAASVDDLDEVFRIASKARNNTRSMGVALAPGSIPETGEPTFELPENELEIGMGLHGEKGVSRGPMLPADPLVDAMLSRILSDRTSRPDRPVCLLVNDLGATTMMELLIAARRAHQVLRDTGIEVYDTIVGSFCTCQEMAGFSLTLIELDDELRRFYDVPVRSLALTKW